MVTRELLRRFLEGRCSPKEVDMLRGYLSEGNLEKLHQILDQDWREAEEKGGDVSTDFNRKRILGRLRKELAGYQPVGMPGYQVAEERSWIRRKWPVAAAISFLMLALGGFMLWNKSFDINRALVVEGALTERINKDKTPEVILLPDGSRVMLDSGSVLRYPSVFDESERLVQLSGKAFFEVVSDSLKPFFVKTTSLNVKVLGTSFSVSSFEDKAKSAEVSVVTGKVSVFVAKEEEGLILVPNERAIRLDESVALAKTLVEEPLMVRSEELDDLFDFDEAPIVRVFEALERAYDVKIRFDRALVEHCTLQARLDDQPLFVKLDMICTSLGLEYEISGTDIVITGRGC